jgi:hypothetical protein
MITYKISKENWATYQLFNDILEAEQWTLINLGTGYIVEISPDVQVETKSPQEKLDDDINFGKILIEMFLLDNRLIVPSVTPIESLELLNKFQNVEILASLGDIKSVKAILYNISVDNRLFTQERKDKYLSLINEYQ